MYLVPLFILIVVGAGAEGQRTRQGFRPRSFVPQEDQHIQEERYAAGFEGVEEHEQQRRDYSHNRWSENEPIKAATSQSKRTQVWDDEEYEDKESRHDNEYQNDEIQQSAAAQERQQFRYPSYNQHPHHKPLRPFTTPIPILRLDKEQRLDGSYKTSYETGNSIVHEETGFMKEMKEHGGGPHEMLVQQGSYSYTDADGNEFTVRYTADENGFRAHGDHFPTPPPVPPEIQKGLDQIYEQIRLDAERRLSEKKYVDDNDADDYNGEYSSQVEQKTTHNNRQPQQPQPSQDQLRNHFRTVNQKQQIQEYNKQLQQNEQQMVYNRNIHREVGGSQTDNNDIVDDIGPSDIRGSHGQSHTDIRGSHGPIHADIRGSHGPIHADIRGSHGPNHADIRGSHGPIHADIRGTHEPNHADLRGTSHGPNHVDLRGTHGQNHVDLRGTHGQNHADLRGTHGQNHADLRGTHGPNHADIRGNHGPHHPNTRGNHGDVRGTPLPRLGDYGHGDLKPPPPTHAYQRPRPTHIFKPQQSARLVQHSDD